MTTKQHNPDLSAPAGYAEAAELRDSEQVICRIDSRTPAVLTDQRLWAFVKDRRGQERSVSLAPGSFGVLRRSDWERTRGDLDFAPGSASSIVPLSAEWVHLEDIEDVKQIERLIQDVLVPKPVGGATGLEQRGDTSALTDTRLLRELDEGELLIWAGRPDPWRLSRAKVLIALSFGVGLIGIAAGGAWFLAFRPSAIHGSHALLLVLLGLCLLVGLLALLLIRVTWKTARDTLFALTDRRCILTRPLGPDGSETLSFFPHVVSPGPSPKRKRPWWKIERPRRLGSIVFGRVWKGDGEFSMIEAIGFDALPDPDAIADLIRTVLPARSESTVTSAESSSQPEPTAPDRESPSRAPA